MGLIFAVGCSNNDAITGTDLSLGLDGQDLNTGDDDGEEKGEEDDKDKEDEDYKEEDWQHYSCKCGGQGEEGARRRSQLAQLIKEAKVTINEIRINQGNRQRTIPINKEIDLVALQEEMNALLPQLAIPASQLSGDIRLYVVKTRGNTAKLSDDSSRPLILPSAMFSGIKVSFRREGTEANAKFVLDPTCNFRINGKGYTPDLVKRVLFTPVVDAKLK